MKVGDKVRTTDHWNENHKPMNGKITKIFPSGGLIDMPIIELDNGKNKINEFWLELI